MKKLQDLDIAMNAITSLTDKQQQLHEISQQNFMQQQQHFQLQQQNNHKQQHFPGVQVKHKQPPSQQTQPPLPNQLPPLPTNLSPAQKISVLLSAEPCIMHFARATECPLGASCPRSHSPEDRRVCAQFRRGQCKRGYDCSFVHTAPGQPASMSSSKANSSFSVKNPTYPPNSGLPPSQSSSTQPQGTTNPQNCRNHKYGRCRSTSASCRYTHHEDASTINCRKDNCTGTAEGCLYKH